MHEIPPLDRRGLREFGVVTGAILAGIFGLFFPWILELAIPVWPWLVGGVLALWGLTAPMSLQPIYRNWMRLGLQLSRITTPLVLGIIFFLIFVPIGLIMRMRGLDPMARHLDDETSTYRVTRAMPKKKNMERPF